MFGTKINTTVFFVEKVMFECLQVMADHRVRSGWNLSDTGGDCITGSLLPADTRDPWGEGPDSDQYALCYKLAWGRLMYDTSRYIQVFELTQKWSLCFYLSLWVSSAVSDVFFLFLWSRHLAAQIVSHRARLPSKACVQPDVSVTYFIIGSNQHQSPIKHEAVADGGCVLRCLVCLSGSVKYLLIRKKGNPCFPAGWMLPSTAFND